MKQKCNKEYPYYCMNPDHTHGNEYYSGTCYCGQNGANPRETLEHARRVNLDMLKEAKLPTQGEMIEVRDKQLANDGMPKQGEMIDVFCGVKGWRQAKFICNYGDVIIYEKEGNIDYGKNSWRFPSQKTELTLAEIEKKLGIDAGSLIIKE